MHFKFFKTFMIWNSNLGSNWKSSNFINPNENSSAYRVQLQLNLRPCPLSSLVVIYTDHFIYHPLGLITYSFMSLANISPLNSRTMYPIAYLKLHSHLKVISNSVYLKQNSGSSPWKPGTGPLFAHSLNGTSIHLVL